MGNSKANIGFSTSGKMRRGCEVSAETRCLVSDLPPRREVWMARVSGECAAAGWEMLLGPA